MAYTVKKLAAMSGVEMELADYDSFLAQRRRLMATKLRAFYLSL